MEVLQPIQNKGYALYLDKFYSFPELQCELMTENSMSLTEPRATVRINQSTIQHKAATRVRLKRNQVMTITDKKKVCAYCQQRTVTYMTETIKRKQNKEVIEERIIISKYDLNCNGGISVCLLRYSCCLFLSHAWIINNFQL